MRMVNRLIPITSGRILVEGRDNHDIPAEELRRKIGDKRFFDVVRAWPEAQENRSSNREEMVDFFEEHTGEELSAFFDAWLLGRQTPPRG
jgi:hypothetical protein